MSAPGPWTPATQASPSGDRMDYVTFTVADQLFGIPILAVHDVLTMPDLTPVPLARADFAGLVNMRGRVVTAIDLRARLGLPTVEVRPGRMAIGIEAGSESFGLIVDTIGEVVTIDHGASRAVQPDESWARLTHGIHRVDGALLVVLDVAAVLDIGDPELEADTRFRISLT